MVKSHISDILPDKYKKRHQLMLYLYDILVDILVKADDYKLSDLSFKFVNETRDDFELFEELTKRKDLIVSEQLLIPHIYFSLLRDLNYYLFESLSCIERGKVTVAFSLARKPLQDNLFYLSWILVHPQDFLEKIQYGIPKEYDVSEIKGDRKTITSLFSEATKMIHSSSDFLDVSRELLKPELLYDVIYNRKAPNSLTGAFDKSIHLVTRNKHYPTENQNLNFVFADDTIWDEYWGLYYEKIPYILLYLVEVSIAIFEKYLDIKEGIPDFNRYIRSLKSLQGLVENEDMGDLGYIFELLFSSGNINIMCDECGNKYEINMDLIKELKEDYLYTCQKCGTVENLGQYFISNEIITTKREIVIDNSDDNNWKII